MSDVLSRINMKIKLNNNGIEFLSHKNVNKYTNRDKISTLEADTNGNRTESGLISIDIKNTYSVTDIIDNDIGYDMAYLLAKEYGAFIVQTGNTEVLFSYQYKSGNDDYWMEKDDRKKKRDGHSYAIVDTDFNIIPADKLFKEE